MVTTRTNLFVLFAAVLLCLGSAGCTKELRRSRHLSRGDSEFKAQQYDKAEIEYLKVLQVSPLDPVALGRLGIIYQEEGRFLRAHAYLVKAAELDPDNAEVRLKLAFNDLSLGSPAKAADDARLVLKKVPGQTDALEIFSASATSSNRLQDVQQQIEKLRQADKDQAGYHVAFATLSIRRGELTNAETEFKKAIELDPKCASALIGLGGIYANRRDLVPAEQSLKAGAEVSPLRSVHRLKFAEFQYATGKTNEARTSLEQVTSKAPDYLPAWNFLAQLAFGEKRYADCGSILQRVLSRDNANVDALMLDGNLKMAQNDPAGALATFTKMSTIFTRSPQVYFLMARAQLLNNETAKAMGSLNQAVSLNPEFTDAVLLLANLSIRKGDATRAVSLLNDLIQRQPRLAQAQLLLVDAYLAKKDPDQALAVCRRMSELFANNAEVQVIYGTLLARQHQNAAARQSFEKALALAPGSLVPVEKLVELDLLENKYSAAIQRVQPLVDSHPSAAEPWLILGKIHFTQARALVDAENKKNPARRLRLADVPSAQPELKSAEDALIKAIDLNPGLQTSYLMLADLYVASGKQQQALDRLNGLLSKTNDVAALMQAAIIQDSLKNYPAARDDYEKLLSVRPNFSPAINNLAYLYSEHLGDLDKASTMAEKARQLLPDDPSTADTLGWVLYKKGDYTRALTLLEDSAAKIGDQPEVQFHLGMTQYSLGEEDAARLALQKALNSPKDFPGKDQAVLRLAFLSIDPKTATDADLTALQKQVQDSPRDLIALERLGAIQERDGALDKAVDTYQTAIKYGPRDSALTFKLAQLYASPRLNDPQKALALAKTAHDQSPDNPRISALLGELVYRTGDCKWAASLLEDSARKLPDDPQVNFDLAWAYYGIGRVADAQSLMQKVASADPPSQKKDEAGRFLSAVAAAGSPADATAYVGTAQQILGADPNYVPALMVSAMGQEAQGNYTRASEIYSQILSRYPLFAPAARNLGVLYFVRLKDDQKAYDLVLKSRETFPQDAEIAKALGVLTYRKGNYSRAAQLLKESAQSRTNDAELFYYLGMAQYQLKARPESKATLQQALSFNLPAKLADDAKRVLAELK